MEYTVYTQWPFTWWDLPGLVNIQTTMDNHSVSWENALFLWQFSIAMLVYQRVMGNMMFNPASVWFWGAPFYRQNCVINPLVNVYIYIAMKNHNF